MNFSDKSALPFYMASDAALRSGPKDVFAHYFYPFPLQIDDVAASADYYSRNYLKPSGESNKFLTQGGYLRSRPLSLPVTDATKYLSANMQLEILMAAARGITGFTVDILSFADAMLSTGRYASLRAAAAIADPTFKIVPMLDLTSLGISTSATGLTQTQAVQLITLFNSYSNAYRIPDGRLLVTAYSGTLNPASWWKSVIATLNAAGVTVALLPIMPGAQVPDSTFTPIIYGWGGWGTATPGPSAAITAATAHAVGLKYMAPILTQQYRPKDSVFWEAQGSLTFRNSWNAAIESGADFVQIITWSDFSESGQVQPYTDASLSGAIGNGFYDLNAYYAQWFLTGSAPEITQDVVYWFHRQMRSSDAHPNQKGTTANNGDPEKAIVELVSFLTDAGGLVVNLGTSTTTVAVPKGIGDAVTPYAPGVPSFALQRNGSNVFAGKSPVTIYDTKGIPSGVTDMTYWSGSLTRKGLASYALIGT